MVVILPLAKNEIPVSDLIVEYEEKQSPVAIKNGYLFRESRGVKV